MTSGKPTPILPPRQKEERPLFIIMVIMSFLASLILLIALMGLRQSQDWQSDLQSSATLQVLPNSEDELQKALDISEKEICELARNSFRYSLLDQEKKDSYLKEVEAYCSA